MMVGKSNGLRIIALQKKTPLTRGMGLQGSYCSYWQILTALLLLLPVRSWFFRELAGRSSDMGLRTFGSGNKATTMPY
jgi:hypothetical protein